MVEKQRTVAEIQKELVDGIRLAIQEIWPSSDAPIQDFDILLGSAGIAIDVRYQAARDLGDVPINMVQKGLRTRLGIADLTLEAERILPARAPGDPHDASDKRKRK